jgi:hypothetical protein
MPPRRASILISDPSVVDRMSSCGPVDYDRSRTSAANIGVFGSISSCSNIFGSPCSQIKDWKVGKSAWADRTIGMLARQRVCSAPRSISRFGDHVGHVSSVGKRVLHLPRPSPPSATTRPALRLDKQVLPASPSAYGNLVAIELRRLW